jgi:hypothetical protein
MKEVINPINRDLLKKELTNAKFLRHTNKGNNEIYIITYHDSPNVMKEIGRLRELTFRSAGGGTGKDMDIDQLDYSKDPYKQLIAWDPESEEIIGGYRYIVCDQNTDPSHLATYKLFNFSEDFIQNYLPYTIELGRSFIQPVFQSSKGGRKTLYSLDNLWDGLGALVVDHPNHKYLFGKVTMYPHFNSRARDIILYFMYRQFIDGHHLVSPKNPEKIKTEKSELENLFSGHSYNLNHKILTKEVRKNGENVPPLINAYMNLSKTMMIFGTSINVPFGNVEETGIMLTIKDIYPNKAERHLDSYRKEKEKNQ